MHLTQLGYKYLSLKNANWDIETNIFKDIFFEAVGKINPSLTKPELNRLYQEINLALDNDDLGKVFFEILTNRSGIRLIDFENDRQTQNNPLQNSNNPLQNSHRIV